MKPIVADLFSGLGGWAEGFLAEGYRVVAFDIVDMYRETGTPRNPDIELVLQDVLTIHGSQLKDCAVIVCSPPCNQYSWLAMPWSRSKSDHSKAAKALRKEWETNGPDNRLFDACFRIQREACEAAGHYIPLIVENVRGCQEWTRRADWSYGSFYLWGDIPALMPSSRSMKTAGGSWFRERNGVPQPGIRHEDRGLQAVKSSKDSGGWFNDYKGERCVGVSRTGSKSSARKAASARIAKIPLPLSRHIASVYYPRDRERVA